MTEFCFCICELIPTKQASRRTFNRIREHGTDFGVLRIDNPICANGEQCALVQSVTTDWVGWIPTKEIEMRKVNGN